MKNLKRERKIKPPGVMAAALYAFYINVLIYLLFLVMFIYGRSAIMPVIEEHTEHPEFHFSVWMLLSGVAITYIYIFVLFCVNFAVLKRERYSNGMRTTASIILSLAVILGWNQTVKVLQGWVFDLPAPDIRALRGGMVRDFILGAASVFSAHLMYLSYRRQQITIENEALQAQYERARYEALKNQMDPHFLFNTLNTLNSVISLDPQKARQYVQKLSSILRYTIQTRDTATLAEEIAFTRNYCDLMQIRYGDNLAFVFEISPQYDLYLMVPFGVQTLVENAIKHNTITNRQPLTVTISTAGDGYVVVSNPVNPKIEADPGEGIGLANLSERYRLKWGKDVEISADEAVFSVRLPLVRDENLKTGQQ